MNALRLVGHILLWSGFLAGSFLAVCRAEIADDPWSTIVWPAYGTALAVSMAGVVLLRKSSQVGSDQVERHTGAVSRMSAILTRLRHTLEDWYEQRAAIAVHDFHGLIDDQLVDGLAEFAELRESLIASFGLQQYALIMSEFALAERTINRTWSASADGYVDEVERCLERAIGHLQRASGRLHDAVNAAP